MRDGLFHGIVPMQVTPFHDGRFARPRRPCPRQSSGRPQLDVTSLSALGMAGEFYKLATDELEAVISTVVGASGTLRTLVGVSAPSSEVAARLARHAARAGADGLLVLPPYAHQAVGRRDRSPTTRPIARRRRPADHGPGRLGRDSAVLPFDALVRLCREVSAVSYIKVEDVAPAPKISRARRGSRRQRHPALRIGRTRRCLDAYDRGAVGCISGAATADLFARLDAAFETDRPLAELRYREMLPLIQFQCQSTELFIASEKQILLRKDLDRLRSRPQPGVRVRRRCSGTDSTRSMTRPVRSSQDKLVQAPGRMQ